MNAPAYPDLFPETLLVNREGDRIYTTSLKVAEHFKKRHTHVLRAIENLFALPKLENERNLELTIEGDNQPNFGLVAEFNALNFEVVDYIDAKGEHRKMYRLTHDGFAFLAMGFTGAQAAVWKIEFLNAFRVQERALAQITSRYATAFDVVRPCLRRVVEGTEQGMSRSAIAQPMGKSANAITYHRRRARELGLL